MTISFRFISKLGLLLAFIGFNMPMFRNAIFGSSGSGGWNGFLIASSLVNSDENTLYGRLLYLSIITALLGVVIGVLLLIGRGWKISPTIDWIVVLVCIISGLIVYFGLYIPRPGIIPVILCTGVYMILAGWIVAFVAQILSSLRRE